MTGLMFSPNSGSGSSPVSQRTQYGSACPNLISPGSGSRSRGTPDNSSSTCHTACSAYSATASPSRGLSQIPFPVLRQIPSVGTSAPSQTDHGAAPSSAGAGNCVYRRMPETSSVHHTPGAVSGSCTCQIPNRTCRSHSDARAASSPGVAGSAANARNGVFTGPSPEAAPSASGDPETPATGYVTATSTASASNWSRSAACQYSASNLDRSASAHFLTVAPHSVRPRKASIALRSASLPDRSPYLVRAARSRSPGSASVCASASASA